MPLERLDQGGLVLQSQPEGQVHLAALHVPGVVGRPEHAPGLAVQRSARSDLLVHVHQQAVGDHARLQVNACLLHLELIGRLAPWYLLGEKVVAQVAADGDEAIQGAGPHVTAGVEVFRRQHVLREDLAEGRALTAAGGIDVTLAALVTVGDRQVRLRARARGAQQQHQDECRRLQSGNAPHCGAPTLNSAT